MLSRIIKNTLPLALKNLQLKQLFLITAPKSLSSKKKRIYESQSTLASPELMNKIELSPEEKKNRLEQIQQMFFQFGRETIQLYKSALPTDRKNEDIKSLFFRHHAKIAKECQVLSPLQLINYIEIVKNISLTKLQFIEQVQVAYSELQNVIKRDQQLNVVKEHFKTLWSEDCNIQTRIRSLCLIQYIDEETRTDYLKKVTPLVQYFKTAQILMVMYEKWKYKYAYHYELIDQIHQNQTYCELEDINLSYYKMLFLESIKGQFIPNDDGVYNKIFHSFIDRPNVLNHSAFNKFVKMLHSQLFFLQTQFTRFQLQSSLNTFVNIAKNQNYDKSVMNLDQLVQIYLGFEEINSTGQILLSEITFFSKTYNFKINKQNFSLYQKLMKSVLKNIEKKIKYQRRDSLNKSYTMDTINFLNEFLPKYIQIQPTIILDVNQASRELFNKSENGQQLLKKFQQTFKQIINQEKYKISLQNIDFTLKLLRFVKTFKHLGHFSLSNQVILRLLKQFIKKDRKNAVTNQQIQVLYWILSLYEKRPDKEHCEVISNINAKVVEKSMSNQLKNSQQNNLVISLDHNVVWLSLCSAKIRTFHIKTDEQILESFINKKLFYLINSLQYRQVYDILVYTLSIKHIKMQVYQRLLYNLSTFITYIDEKKVKNTNSTSSFYLNQYYLDLYVPICKLILQNKLLFKKIEHKDAFKILQIIMMKFISSFNNQEILELLYIIGSPQYLTISINKYLQQLKFNPSQMQKFEYVNYLKDYEYYNRSISKYFQGKYSEKEIKNKLKNQIMTQREIEECFQNFEVYETIFMDGQLITRFDIPEPKTNIVDYKSLFICQRIFKKIKQSINFDFEIPRETVTETSQKGHQGISSIQTSKAINLQYESNYIKKEILQLQKQQNELRIPNRMLPKYLKVQVWRNFSFFNKNLTIDPKDLFSNKKLTDQILTKIVKSVLHQSLEKMREVLRQFSCRQELVEDLRQQNIEFEQHGAALHFSAPEDGKKQYILLCSQNSNYKILYICAYFLQRQGFDVAVLKSDQNTQTAINYLKRRFATTKKQIQIKTEQVQIQQEQQ